MNIWIPVTAERVLYVDRGRDVLLCDRQSPGELLVQLSSEQAAATRDEITRSLSTSPQKPEG